MSNNIYWIWLSLALDYAPRALKELLSIFKDAKGIYEAVDIDEIKDLSPRERERLAKKDLSRAEEIADICLREGFHIIPYTDPRYPELLRKIADPPALLYLCGTIPEWNARPCIGVIGQRAMTYYGGESTFEISYDLARMGCITVSGMALGVDGLCAASTLQARGCTVAVLGSGLDVIYPPEHEYLYECIVKNNGAVISEFAPGERPERFHFPIRNRIISGLSRAVIVIEGDAGSGSLITARRAVAQERPVFAVPGRIGRASSEGPLLLLKHGKAQPITCADDIYDRFREEYLPYMNPFELLKTKNTDLETVMEKYHVVCGKPKVKTLPSDKGSDTTAKRGSIGAKVAGKIRSFLFEPLSKEEADKREAARIERIEKEILEKELAMMHKMSDVEQKIYKQIPYGEEVHPDAIILGDMTIEEILSTLMLMEMNGFVSSTSGGTFIKNIE